MSNKSRINSVVIFVLAVLFVFFFNITKHQPSLSSVNPFAEDPYDAIGSFAFQAVILFGLLALFRAFRPHSMGGRSDWQKLMLVRTQAAVVLCVSVTLIGDLVAMIRHWSLWSGKPAGLVLLILTVGFSVFATAIGIFVHRSTDKIPISTGQNSWTKPVLVSLLFFLLLFTYPENVRESVPGALFTVVVGAVLLFMSVWAWGNLLFPDSNMQQKTVTPKWLWGVVILIGILLGFSIVLRELTAEGGAVDLAGSLFVISIYIGLEVSGILIGFAFLGKFLGLLQIER